MQTTLFEGPLDGVGRDRPIAAHAAKCAGCYTAASARFAAGGVLTQVLMVVFFVIIGSGMFGLFLQNLIPRMMMRQVETDTIFQQIPHVIDQLRSEAIECIESVCGPLYSAGSENSPRLS